ncbi:phosphoenolpyruvate--protein phosphotransferase [Mesoterricola silvestris]|uniref:phosphoenolpyruvate--protein phosphotransferase n=1 Tax=Mesoterricola silvestris TaxID=2927979 RepID=A0AA48K9W6_9BACT|nr:phosphoenolpyruvate--protein phosphotransferase [Mesoterricola silvestris]BDU73956.1 phosphoenolpyruvate--protein phosphotransferase [Mesoterricola silvestris]
MAVHLELTAPLSGVLVPLDDVPDPVFAGRLTGDGIAIDPTSTELLAPLAGTVSQLHAARHAVAITSDQGLEVLLHIGIDTVALKGDGFEARVRVGDRVRQGQPLLAFDPVLVGRRARSLLTLMVIPDGARVRSLRPASGRVAAGRDAALALTLEEAGAGPGAAGGEAVECGPVVLPNPAGLHARPAAILAAEAKRFPGSILILKGDAQANAKSVVALLGLGAGGGDALRVRATGPGAAGAAGALAALLAAGCGDTAAEAPAPAPRAAAGAGELAGLPASPGLAVGRIHQHRPEAAEVEETPDPARDPSRLEAALAAARLQLDATLSTMEAGSPRRKILEAHRELLEDPELTGPAFAGIASGLGAAKAWREAFSRQAAILGGLDSALLRERAGDIRDVGRRVLAQLTGAQAAPLEVPESAILVAEELTPSEAAQLDRTRVRGLCTTTGGPTGHVALLARSMGIPAICGLDPAALDLPDGTPAVVDGTLGLLRRDPGEADLARLERQAAQRALEREAAQRPALTADGFKVEVAANIRDARDAREAVAAGAEAVGLLRSEFLFRDRAEAPSEDAQTGAYGACAEALGPGRKLVVRTLDVGGDKPLAYQPLPREENPFLGLRGVRVSLDRPELFRAQLRALLRAAPLGDLHIMFPMVATLEELRAAKALLAEEAGAQYPAVKVGAMIEVPSAALIADALAREVDFLSIGTNDLTQYCLAMDRGHPKLAKQADGLHPAVLRLIALTVEAAHRHGKWVGVCGGLASDPLALPALLGLGVDELSVDIPAIGAVKVRLSRLVRAECVALARELLTLSTATEVRARLASVAD